LLLGNENAHKGWLVADRSTRNMLNVRVCLVLTNLHSGEFVESTLESIKQQSHQNIETIIVDDRSNYETVEVAKRHGHTPRNSSDFSIHVIALSQKRNGGMGQPANIGIEACSNRSKYVMFLKGGDLMEYDAIEKMILHSATFKSHLVIADFHAIGTKEQSIIDMEDEAWAKLPQDTIFNVITHPRVLLLSPVSSRKLYSIHLFQELQLGYTEGDYAFEEIFLHWSTIIHSSRISKLNRVLFHLRQSDHSGTLSLCESEGKIDFRSKYSERSRLAGYFPIFFKIGAEIFDSGNCTNSINRSNCIDSTVPVNVALMYFTWLNHSRWISERQCTQSMAGK